MVGSVVRRCDGCDVIFPKAFRVRIYDYSLNFKRHNVLRYPTDFVNVFKYVVLKTNEKFTIWTDKEVVIARKEQHGTNIVMRFLPDTTVEQIVCAMITNNYRWAVLDDSPESIEQTLF